MEILNLPLPEMYCFFKFVFVCLCGPLCCVHHVHIIKKMAACVQNVGRARTTPKAVQTEPVKISLKDCLACR